MYYTLIYVVYTVSALQHHSIGFLLFSTESLHTSASVSISFMCTLHTVYTLLSFTHISHTMYTCSCSISIVSLRFTTSSFIHSLYFSRARCDFNLLLPHIVYTKHWYQRVCAPVLRSHTITRSVANMLFARVYGYVTFCLATKLSNLILLNGVQFVCLPFSLRWQ